MPPPDPRPARRRPAAGKALVIVESPAKARTIGGLLGPDFVVESSVGHIRDLPRRADEVPAAYKGEGWARLGVDVDNGFKPLYVVAPEKKSVVAKLKRLLKQADEVYLATDEDREGESIAWHLSEVLSPQVPVKRMVFHEITPAAIQRAVEEWRDLDRRLVDAQEARRILDRLYGYEVSPVLWKKIMPRLSAGRVQSVATRMIVERGAGPHELPLGHLVGPGRDLRTPPARRGRAASLRRRAGGPGRPAVATGPRLLGDRRPDGPGQVRVLGEAEARGPGRRASTGRPFTVQLGDREAVAPVPGPPFMTSTLQQEAGRKLRFGAQRTMQVAQRLYEQGWITYMRTDSTTLSDEALTAARAQAASSTGPSTCPSRPGATSARSRTPRRPTKPSGRPARLSARPSRPRGRCRATSCASTTSSGSARWPPRWLTPPEPAPRSAWSARCPTGVGRRWPGRRPSSRPPGRVITFPGSCGPTSRAPTTPRPSWPTARSSCPPLAEGDASPATALEPGSHTTQPPARYTEASLVKALEELGVGRPSTYASVIGTIQDRGYVWKKGTALVPRFTAFAVVGLLEQYFGDLVDYGFTAAMENDLDEIAGVARSRCPG